MTERRSKQKRKSAPIVRPCEIGDLLDEDPVSSEGPEAPLMAKVVDIATKKIHTVNAKVALEKKDRKAGAICQATLPGNEKKAVFVASIGGK